jgi:hypothetical protein
MHKRLVRFAAVVALGAGFALAWRLELWLIVVGMAALVLTLITQEQIEERALAQRAAACALHAPEGGDGTALEQTLAADLATTADADMKTLQAAISHVEQAIADPWLRSLAIERLALAKRLVAESALPSPLTLTRALAARRTQATIATATVLLVLAAVVTRYVALFIPITVGVVALVISLREVRQRDALPRHLWEDASTEPPPRGWAISEPSVVAALGALTGGRTRVLDRAAAIVNRTRGQRTDGALRRLNEARRVHARRRPRTLTRPGLAWATAAAAFVLAVEVVL